MERVTAVAADRQAGEGIGREGASNFPRIGLVALVAAMTVGLGACLAVTLVWKISVQSAAAAGIVVILTLVFGPAMAGLSLLVVVVGWTRVELSKHSLAQVIVGSGLGAVVAAGIFELLR